MISAIRRPVNVLSLLGYCAFILIGWNAVLIPALIRSVEHDFHQSDAAFAGFYFLSALLYAAGSFGGGFLTERVGRRIVLPVAALLLAVGLVGEGLAPSWIVLLLAAPAVNWGAGAIDGGVNGLFLDLYREARGGALNLLHFFFSVGALASPFVVGQLVTFGVNWRLILLVTGACCVVLSALLGLQQIPSGRVQAAPSPAEQIGREETSLLPFFCLAAAICFYVAAETGISNWLVKFLAAVPVSTATAVLSVFWAGLALGRLLSRWVAERVDYILFTVACLVLSSAAAIGAVIAPVFPLSAALFAVTGLFYGPVYPMIMALGGNIYPRRLSALSGGLATAAVVGSVAYPPLMGIMAARVGLGAGIVGAGILGVPAVLAIVVVSVLARRSGAGRTPTEVHAAS